ncbi:MAG TPA: carotenoid oxygenase family protein, partial [Candidatus Binataceae bacterium]|nr:carotenoid oxygenase family protein [Candidatus Binataceae bacterium]
MLNSDNPYLGGNYAPWREEGDAFDLEVDGEIPRELNGALYRIGPNPHFVPAGRYHWFDGDGMVHAVLLRDGRAAYRNRYVRTDGLRAEMKAGHSLYGGLLGRRTELPPDVPPMKNAANTNIIGYANRLLALWEAGLPHELRPETLETIGMFDFGGRLNGPVTAHPKFDPNNGDLLFFGYQPMPPFVTWYRAGRDGTLLESRAIDTGVPVMMHDFVTTDDYAIFFVCPSVFKLENMASGKPLLAWEPERGTRIGAMNRATGEVKWFSTEAFYIFHFLNAYQEDGKLVVDGCRMPELDMTGNSFGSRPLPWRWTLDLKSGAMSDRQIDDLPSEFPRLDERLAGFKHRYGYFAAAPSSEEREFGFGAVAKRDYLSGRTEIQELGGHKAPGEPVFVPRAGSHAEDDGWVLSMWYD